MLCEGDRGGIPTPDSRTHPKTIALSIAEEIGGYTALWAIRDSGGKRPLPNR